MSKELCLLSAVALAKRIASKDVSPVEVVEAYLARIDRTGHTTNAYVLVTAEDARKRAESSARRVARGTLDGPLHGVPVAIKDLYDKAGVKTTFGSRVFADYVARKSQLMVERLEDAGAIVLGKTNTPEFGAKPVTDNTLFGATSTPLRARKKLGWFFGGQCRCRRCWPRSDGARR